MPLVSYLPSLSTDQLRQADRSAALRTACQLLTLKAAARWCWPSPATAGLSSNSVRLSEVLAPCTLLGPQARSSPQSRPCTAWKLCGVAFSCDRGSRTDILRTSAQGRAGDRRKRREFIMLLGSIGAWPMVGHAQTSRLHRVGVMVVGDSTTNMMRPQPSNSFTKALLDGMRNLG